MNRVFSPTIALILALALAFACASPTKTKTVYVPVDDDSPADDDASPAADDDTEDGWTCSEVYGIATDCGITFRDDNGDLIFPNDLPDYCEGGKYGLGLGGCIANCIIDNRAECSIMASCVQACEMPS
jgi:hypothetical protein